MDPFVRLSQFMARHRWVVVGVFAVVVIGGMALFGSRATDAVVPTGVTAAGSSSATAATILSRDFHQDPYNTALVVFTSKTATVDDPSYRSQVLAATRIIQRLSTVTRVATYYGTHDPAQVSNDRHTSFIEVFLRGTEKHVEKTAADLPNFLTGITLQHATSGRAAIAGDTTAVSETDLQRAELVTIPVVLILLLLVFRTVVAALIPLILGVCAISVTESAVYILGSHTDVSVYALNVASIIGLGLGIDFALIVLSRYRRELRQNPDVLAAIGRTMATSGRSITYSGLTVILSMAILTLVMLPLTIVRSMGLALMVTSIAALLAALLLLPALLALLGHRIESLRILPHREAPPGSTGAWYRFSRQIMRHPWVWLGMSLVLLLIIISPIRDLAVAGPTTQALPSSDSSVQGSNLIATAFGPGYAAPIDVVIEGGRGGIFRPALLREIQHLTAQLSADPRVQSVESVSSVAQAAGLSSSSVPQLTVSSVATNRRLSAALRAVVYTSGGVSETVVHIVPRSGQYSADAEALVRHLRSSLLPPVQVLTGANVYVGGQTAELIDFSASIYGRFPFVILAVVLLVFAILAMFFQSLFLPIKAILLNALSILATYGALTVVFIWGFADRLLGFHASGLVNVVTPVILFTILFALSTDYEVFMLSRVREFYAVSHDNIEAVSTGLQNTAGVITAAGLILMFTFGSFATAELVTVKEVGIGLAVGILIDSTVVRVVMVPATMRLLGDRNWWMPAWMKRFVPELREEPAPLLTDSPG